jgi:isoquinoline 1-oxidoreductase beta subunit
MTLIKTNYNRRSFIKVSSLSTGGMLLGFSWLASCKPDQVANIPKEWFDINAFLKIADNGMVTIMSPNPEIGQNVKTSMPMIVAEELDIDWEQVIVEQAGFDINKYTRQLAGGSQSIRQGWESLRMAGATARHLLMEAAARQWQVAVTELSTQNGVIKYQDQELGYGEVAGMAASMPVPDEVKLKNPEDFKIIGTAKKNVDGKDLVTGKPLFGLDTTREGMLIAMIEHPPAFGMKLKSMDASAAKALPGIHDIFSITTIPEGKEMTRFDSNNVFNELVAVVGNSTWEVMKAKRALKIEWEQASPLENSLDHNQGLYDLLGKKTKEPSRVDGNPKKAFKNAAKVVERIYSAPYLAHNTMEPMNFFADVKEGEAELVGPIQTPEYMSKTASQVLEIPEEKISVMMTRMGGGFGRRLYGHFGIEAAVISQKVKAPVKLVYSREDDMTQGTYRPSYKVRYRAALDANNQLVGFEVRGVGTKDNPLFANRFPAGAVTNYLADSHSMESNISIGAWRAPRSNFIAGAEQAFLDEVAEVAGKDPIDFRLELFDRAMKNPVGDSNDYDAERYAGVLKLVKEKSNWGTNTPGVYRGVSAYYCHNSYVAQVVDVVMEGDRPKVKNVCCAVDCGIVVNTDAAVNMVEGGTIDGIGHAMYSAITFKDGSPEQSNFDRYRLIRHSEAPESIEVHFVDNGIDPTGLGEPPLPPAIGALANALYQATGKRLYDQPFVGQALDLG